jgi:A/G-specific adenine glycosylase
LDGVPEASSTRKAITAIAREMISKERPGDFNEAMMDVGATICTPKSPFCEGCPFRTLCKAVELGTPERFPGIKKSPPLPCCPYTVCAVIRKDAVWIRKRPSEGLLAGLYEFPMFPGHLSEEDVKQAVFSSLGIASDTAVQLEKLPDSGHRFSHMIWDMRGYLLRIGSLRLESKIPLSFAEAKNAGAGMFCPLDEVRKLAFPTALRAYTQVVLSITASLN